MKLPDSRRKLQAAGVVILVSAVVIAVISFRPRLKEDYVIETTLEPQSYIATHVNQASAQEPVSLQDGIPDGYGVNTRPDGSVYVGNFVNGQSHGKGKITYPGGASYEGEFSEGMPHGSGICTYSSGRSEECRFLLGQRQ